MNMVTARYASASVHCVLCLISLLLSGQSTLQPANLCCTVSFDDFRISVPSTSLLLLEMHACPDEPSGLPVC